MNRSNPVDFEERLVATFGSVVFGAPILFLIWFGLNTIEAKVDAPDELLISADFLYGSIFAIGLLGFVIPRQIPNVIGVLIRKFYWLFRSW